MAVRTSRRMRALCIAIVLTLFTLVIGQVMAKPFEAKRWVESRSQNFVLRTDLSRKRAEATLQNLELLRATILMSTPTDASDLPAPKFIYLLSSGYDYVDYGYGADIAGTRRSHYPRAKKGYLTDANGDAILVAMHLSDPRRNSPYPWHGILRDYVHFLHGAGDSEALPAWYRYGIENYFSTANARAGAFEIGVSPAWIERSTEERWDWYTWPDLLSGDFHFYSGEDGIHGRQWFNFVTQSWLLVHFLMNEPGLPTTLGEGLNTYMRLTAESGENPVSAFEATFGVAVSELTPRLLAYLKGRCCRVASIPIEVLLPEFNPVTIRLTKEQISLGLAENALLLGDLDRAQYWFTVATTDSELANAANAGLAEVLTLRNRLNDK